MKIVAIGGGEITRDETLALDKEIIRLTGNPNPRLLFIPTASNDSEGYCQIISSYFKKLGCSKVSHLKIIGKPISKADIENTLALYDAVYVGGGNTKFMTEEWKRVGLDKALIEASKKGLVLSGISAGSICWFKYGNSDSEILSGQSDRLIRVSDLNIIPALHCPHYDTQTTRQGDLKQMLKESGDIVSIALDDCSALEIFDNSYRIIKSKDTAKARKIYWKNNEYLIEEINSSDDFKSLASLLTI